MSVYNLEISLFFTEGDSTLNPIYSVVCFLTKCTEIKV